MKSLTLTPPPPTSPQSGKAVVDQSTSQELQEANQRLRERLARMVHHKDTHTHI